MSAVFGPGYAGVYDALYAEKDYESESALLERIFRDHSRPVNSVLDIGCGTGGHALRLARDGYEVVGVDRSAEMIAQAGMKVAAQDDKVRWQQADASRLDLGRRFDAAIMMFATLGYQIRNDEVLTALTGVRRHIEPGGLFVFDIWYGPAVLSNRPEPRIRTVATESGKILRTSSGTLDTSRHLCTVRFHVLRIEHDRLVEEIEEDHAMRFFFPLELAHLLEVSGLQLRTLRSFPDFDREPSEDSWSAIGVAEAV